MTDQQKKCSPGCQNGVLGGRCYGCLEAGSPVGQTVTFWEYDQAGEMTKYAGKVLDRFVDPEEKYCRPSLVVQLPSGDCMTPYEDECREEEQGLIEEYEAERYDSLAGIFDHETSVWGMVA